LIDKFLTLYTPDAPKWDNISDLASSLGWLDLAGNSTDRYLTAQGISKEYIHELVEAATRVNYGQVCLHLLIPLSPSHHLLQDVVNIHALEGVVSMAASGASTVKGGNFQIFEQFLNRSGAKVFLNTPVRPSNLDIYDQSYA
jgi:prenylcysteine oxidase/farnesylcysteine lyase